MTVNNQVESTNTETTNVASSEPEVVANESTSTESTTETASAESSSTEPEVVTSTETITESTNTEPEPEKETTTKVKTEEMITLPVALVDFTNLFWSIVNNAEINKDTTKLEILKQYKNKIDFNKHFRDVCYRDLDIIKYFVNELGVDPIYNNGLAFRYVASNTDSLNKVKYFVEELKVDVNISCGTNNALSSACAWGRLEVVKYLVEHGADVKSVILLHNSTLSCKKYIQDILNLPVPPIVPQSYFGIKVSEKLQWSFPNLLMKTHNDQFYYVFLVEGERTKERILSMFSIFEQLKSDTVPGFYTL